MWPGIGYGGGACIERDISRLRSRGVAVGHLLRQACLVLLEPERDVYIHNIILGP